MNVLPYCLIFYSLSKHNFNSFRVTKASEHPLDFLILIGFPFNPVMNMNYLKVAHCNVIYAASEEDII